MGMPLGYRRRAGKSWDEWKASHLLLFSEMEASPLVNLGTLGSAGDATATGTRRLVNTGTKAFVWEPGGTALISGNTLTVPDEAALRITGDVVLMFRVSADDWTPAALTAFGGKDHTTTGRGYALALQTNGRLILFWSPLGTDASAVFRTSTASVPFSDLGAGWVAAWLKADNGASGHDVRFYTAPDSESVPTAWTQLGSTVTTAGVTSIFATTQPFTVGYARSTSANWAGNIHRAIVRTSMDGADILDIDTAALTDEGATSFTATTGQTVTINRASGTGYKTTIVLPGSGKRLFNGTSDLLTVANQAGLNFGASDSFTPWALIRQWTNTAIGRWIDKFDGTSGWFLGPPGSMGVRGYLDDGPNTADINSLQTVTAGSLSLVGFTVNRSAQTLATAVNGTVSATTSTSAVGSLANSTDVRFGRSGTGANFQHVEEYAWGIYPGALTAGERADLRTALYAQFGLTA
mgnify:CR=1 FL=1